MFQRIKDVLKHLKTYFVNKMILFPYNPSLKRSILASISLLLIFIMVGWFLVLLDEVVYLYFTFTFVTAFAVIYYAFLKFLYSLNCEENKDELKYDLINQVVLIVGTHVLTGILLFMYIFQAVSSISIMILLFILFTGILVYSFMYNRKHSEYKENEEFSTIFSIMYHGLFHYFIFMSALYIFHIENILLLFFVANVLMIAIQFLKDLYQKLIPWFGDYIFSSVLVLFFIIVFVGLWISNRSLNINIFTNSRDIVSSKLVVSNRTMKVQSNLDWEDMLSHIDIRYNYISIADYKVYYTDTYIYSVLIYEQESNNILTPSSTGESSYLYVDIYTLDLEYVDTLHSQIEEKIYSVSIIDDQLYILEYDFNQELDTVVYNVSNNNSVFSIQKVATYDFYLPNMFRAFIKDDIIHIAVSKTPFGIIELPNQTNIIYDYPNLDNEVIYQSTDELFIEKSGEIFYLNYTAQQYLYPDDSTRFDYYLFYHNGYILRYETFTKTAYIFTVDQYLNDEQGLTLKTDSLDFNFFGDRFFHIDNKFYISLDYLYTFNSNGTLLDRVESNTYLFQEANNNLYASTVDYETGTVSINKIDITKLKTNYMQETSLEKNSVWFYVLYYLLAFNVLPSNPFRSNKESFRN